MNPKAEHFLRRATIIERVDHIELLVYGVFVVRTENTLTVVIFINELGERERERERERREREPIYIYTPNNGNFHA